MNREQVPCVDCGEEIGDEAFAAGVAICDACMAAGPQENDFGDCTCHGSPHSRDCPMLARLAEEETKPGKRSRGAAELDDYDRTDGFHDEMGDE